MLIANRIRFTPAFFPTLIMIIVVIAMLLLGRWQLNRAQEKIQLQNVLVERSALPALNLNGPLSDSDLLPYRHAIARGEWLPTGQIFLNNKVENSKPGYYVITPLKLAEVERILLVNRGWIARGTDYPLPPKVVIPAGNVEVHGTLAMLTSKFMELDSDTIQGDVWQNLTLDRYRQQTKLQTMPAILLAKAESTSLVPVMEIPDAGIEKHRGYAFQWFAMAFSLFIIWLVVNCRFIRSSPASTEK